MDNSHVNYDTWWEGDKSIHNHIKTLPIPDWDLSDVCGFEMKSERDLNRIAKNIPGCYWIWTDEPVHHFMHRKEIPESFNGGRIIYNGMANDIRARIKQHLFSPIDMKWGAMPMDIDVYENPFSKKYACNNLIFEDLEDIREHESELGDLYIQYKRNGLPYHRYSLSQAYLSTKIERRSDLLEYLQLSDKERGYIENSPETIKFRNGINITESKHIQYKFRVYAMGIKVDLYRQHIEKEWRKLYGTPQLCTR